MNEQKFPTLICCQVVVYRRYGETRKLLVIQMKVTQRKLSPLLLFVKKHEKRKLNFLLFVQTILCALFVQRVNQISLSSCQFRLAFSIFFLPASPVRCPSRRCSTIDRHGTRAMSSTRWRIVSCSQATYPRSFCREQRQRRSRHLR